MKARGLLHHTPPEEQLGERFSPYLQSVNTRHNQRHLAIHMREDNIQGFFVTTPTQTDIHIKRLTYRFTCKASTDLSVTGAGLQRRYLER